ncbi:MAG: glycosyltransferase family 2 protein [Faecousia sp.]
MEGVAVIILNYMTWQETLREVQAVQATLKDIPHELIVVDNCSPNDSAAQLSQASGGQFTFLQSDANLGYAAGNNIGLRCAAEKGWKYAWILNNDIEFDDPEVLKKMLSVFARDPAIAAVSPNIYAKDGYLFNRDAVRWNFYNMTFGMLAYKKAGRGEEEAKKGWLYTYRPQGCCMVLDVQKAAQADFLDEHTFLYYEEAILAERLLAKGFRCACCSETGVIHNHSYTVRKTLSKLNYIRNNLKSFCYYLKQYRHYRALTRLVCSGFCALKLLILK